MVKTLIFSAFILLFSASLPAQGKITHWQDVVYNQPITIAANNKYLQLMVALAQTKPQQAQGLMKQSSMPSNAGMLFDFTNKPATIHTMWMKDTLIALDMFFISEEGVITYIIHDTVPHSLARLSSGTASSAVLELNAGTAKKYNVTIGDQIIHPIFKK